MIVLAIDPGTTKSGVVVYDSEGQRIIASHSGIDNAQLLLALRRGLDGQWGDTWFGAHEMDIFVVIETVESFMLKVGKDVFETCIWIGRFQEAWERSSMKGVRMVTRGDEKIVLCGAKNYKDPITGKQKGVSDAVIRRAVMSRFPSTGGGKTPVVGTKKQPGPLYTVKGHAWSALAVALTFIESEMA
jgi:hypothetical protein